MLERKVGNEIVVKKRERKRYSRSGEPGWRVLLRELRRNEDRFEISRLGARYGLSRITSRNARFATNTGLSRHGPTSSPNGRGGQGYWKDFYNL